jgi:hypothetical protein
MHFADDHSAKRQDAHLHDMLLFRSLHNHLHLIMAYTNLGPGDPQTWGPCTGHPSDPRTIEPDQSMLDLTLGEATVTVVYEMAGDEAIVEGCFIGDAFVDVTCFSQHQRDSWQRRIEAKGWLK